MTVLLLDEVRLQMWDVEIDRHQIIGQMRMMHLRPFEARE